MYHIVYEFPSSSHPSFRHIKVTPRKVQIATIHQDIHETLKWFREQKEEEIFLLLDESRFSFYRFDVHQDVDKPFSIHDLNNCIAEKINFINKNHDTSGEKIHTFIDTLYVNEEETTHIIGEQGHIFFRLYVIYLRRQTLHTCNAVFGNILEHSNIHIQPQSLPTTLFVRNTLKKDNFLLLYIHENSCKAVYVQNGFYHNVQTINMGMAMVKTMYHDRGISEYRYKSYETIEKNNLAKQLIIETLGFYCEMLCKRIQDINASGWDIILISPMTKNGHFIEVFNTVYNKSCKRFILPFHQADTLDNFDQKREPEDMDILTFLNQKDKQ